MIPKATFSTIVYSGMPFFRATSTVPVGHALRCSTAWMPAFCGDGEFIAELILADGADRIGFAAVVHGVVGEVHRGAAGTLAGGEHVPQEFAEGDHDWL